ncbi:MAG: molybdenum cofactor guanylyltransferase [Gemmatimonadetes bacterium]|nr:molybdenum cofactor guanylyltransferase [Gemmatimonadota bacterium]
MFLGLSTDDHCSVTFENVFTDPLSRNAALCADIDAHSVSPTTVGFYAGATYRAFPRGFASPYLRAEVGLATRSGSTVEMEGAYLDAGPVVRRRAVIIDPASKAPVPSAAFAFGVMIPVAAGHQARLELRDHLIINATGGRGRRRAGDRADVDGPGAQHRAHGRHRHRTGAEAGAEVLKGDDGWGDGGRAMRGAILAGGNASRFGGRPKGLERVGGERILDRVVAVVKAATGTLPLLVANAPDAAAWRPDLEVVPDVLPRHGSLGGIYTAVCAGSGPVLVVGWDMPFLNADLLGALIAGSVEFDVYAPESGGPRGIEPLCAVYGPACGPAIRECLERKELAAVAFHDTVRVGVLPRVQVEKFGAGKTLFFNVNEPSDLDRAEAFWRA